MKRIFLWLGIVTAVVYVTFVGALAWAMRQPPETFGNFMKHVPGPVYLVLPFEHLWMHARRGAIEPGSAAPDFTLQTADHSATLHLADLRGKQPVVLIFGSYT